MTIYAGIDYSMTCPSICIWDSNKELKFENCQFFFLKKEAKFNKDFKNVHGFLLESYSNDMERFDNASEWAMTILNKYNVKKVAIEGYSMGSTKGLIFNIAENTAFLKYKMFKNNIEVITPAPTTIKKFWTGKGNSKKDAMHDALVNKENYSVADLIGIDSLKSPTSDIVDSYAILQYLVKQG